MKLQLKGKQKILVFAVIGMLAAIFIARFIFSNLGNRLKQLSQQVKLGEAKLKKGIEIQRIKDTIINDYKKYQPYLKIEQMEQRQIIEELLRETERIAKDSGVSIISLSLQESSKQLKEYKKYKADLRMEGSVEQILNFLYKVGDSKLLIKLDRLSFSPKDEQASLLKAETTVSIAIP